MAGFHITHYIKSLDVAGTGTAGHSCTMDGVDDAADELRSALGWMRPGDRVVITLAEDEDARLEHDPEQEVKADVEGD